MESRSSAFRTEGSGSAPAALMSPSTAASHEKVRRAEGTCIRTAQQQAEVQASPPSGSVPPRGPCQPALRHFCPPSQEKHHSGRGQPGAHRASRAGASLSPEITPDPASAPWGSPDGRVLTWPGPSWAPPEDRLIPRLPRGTHGCPARGPHSPARTRSRPPSHPRPASVPPRPAARRAASRSAGPLARTRTAPTAAPGRRRSLRVCAVSARPGVQVGGGRWCRCEVVQVGVAGTAAPGLLAPPTPPPDRTALPCSRQPSGRRTRSSV